MGEYAVELLMNHQGGYCVCKKDNYIIARKIEEALNDESEIQKKCISYLMNWFKRERL